MFNAILNKILHALLVLLVLCFVNFEVLAQSASVKGADGGVETVISSGGVAHRVHQFNNVDSNELVINRTLENLEYLIVAGGGAGGGGYGGGGGGGGGFLSSSLSNVLQGNYSIVVGAGGLAGAVPRSGGNSKAFGFEAVGGGAGATYNLSPLTGGSGGGGRKDSSKLGANGTPLQGFAGGTGFNGSGGGNGRGGGGGGAGGRGTDGDSNGAGAGGVGAISQITGIIVYYAGGGGGAAESLLAGVGGLGGGGSGRVNGRGLDGSKNTGGGGGGGDFTSTDLSITGGNGGSGVVIVRYAITDELSYFSTITASPGTLAANGSSTSTITVQLKDANGNNVTVSGGTVTLTTTLGSLSAVTDNNNGTYTAVLTAGTSPGTATISGTLAGTALASTATVTFVDEVARKLDQIGDRLRDSLRIYAVNSLSDMLSFNESLIRGDNDDACVDVKAQEDLSGSANANQAGGQVTLDYSKRRSECGRHTQVFTDLGLIYSKLSANWSSRLFGSLRFERRVDGHLTIGAGLLASRASNTLTGIYASSISDQSLQLNLYNRYSISDRLQTGAFVGMGRAWYNFALTEADGFALNGDMTSNRQVYGWMLRGNFDVGGILITTDAVISHAREKLGSAILTARYQSENRSGIAFAVGRVDTTRISVPVNAQIELSGSEKFGRYSRLLLHPGLLCEDNDVDDSSLRCGYQLGAKVVANDDGRGIFFSDFRWESVAGLRRLLLNLGIGIRFGRNDNLELNLEINHSLSGITTGRGDGAKLVLRQRL